MEGEHGDDIDGEHYIVARTEQEARSQAEKKFPHKNFVLERDPDVLDTWFSSVSQACLADQHHANARLQGLWPFSTLGWPKITPDFEKLFPTSVLETGWGIIAECARHELILTFAGRYSLLLGSTNGKLSDGEMYDFILMHGSRL